MIKLKTLVAAIVIALPVYANAATNWTSADTARELAFDAASLVDMGQTHYIGDNPQHWQELNPILGSHPSSAKINEYFVGEMAGHYLISYLLPEEYRSYWQTGTLVLELGVVGRNYNLGIGIRY